MSTDAPDVEVCGCEESQYLTALVAGLEKVNAELRAKLRAKGSEVPCHRCGLSKMEADKLGVADMTGPQLRLRVLQLEGELADYKAQRASDWSAHGISGSNPLVTLPKGEG